MEEEDIVNYSSTKQEFLAFEWAMAEKKCWVINALCII